MSESTFQKDAALWVTGFLILSVLFVFGQVLRHDFISFDDPLYVTHNEHVLQGLSVEGLRWAMTAVVSSMWHPLTLVSHMADVELFGVNSGLHHFENVVIHIGSSCLLFFVLRAMTGAVWRSALVAIVFALHPLRVESVAWAAERKDVLSTFFWLATMFAYARYAERPNVRRYALVALGFALGLLSKPMLVTLPFALLLLDYWPLKRIGWGSGRPFGSQLRQLFVEKTPLFALSVAASVVSLYTQGASESIGSAERYPMIARIGNSFVSYVMYIYGTFVPINLAPMYPHSGPDVAFLPMAAAGGVLLIVTVAVLFTMQSHPYAAVGWFWYVGTLAPVIGLVQVGSMARADRYTYIPHIGLLVVVVWTLGALVERWPALKRPAVAACSAAVLALAALSYAQVSYWRDDVTLFSRTVAVSPDSAKAHLSLGIGYVGYGDVPRAEYHFRRSVELYPGSVDARKNWGASLVDLGRLDEGEAVLQDVVYLQPYNPEHHVNLAVALFRQGRYGDAVFRAEEALRIDRAYAPALKMIEQCRKALKPEPILED